MAILGRMIGAGDGIKVRAWLFWSLDFLSPHQI